MVNDTPETPKKRCTVCGVEFPATLKYFSPNKGGRYGLMAACRMCRRIIAAKHREDHREEYRAYKANYYLTHIEEHRAHRTNYNTMHRKEIHAQQAGYRASLRGKIAKKGAEHRRRARKAQSNGAYTSAELDAVLKAHTNKKGQLICAFCGKPIKGQYHIDHWIPLRHGGRNDAGNLRVMHVRCNLHKKATHPHKFGKLI